MVGMTGSPRDICWADGRQLGAGRGVPVAGGLERLAADHLALPDQLDEQLAVVPVVLGRGADADHLGLGHAVGVAPPQRVLAAPDRDLVDALLRHRLQDAVVVLASDELVDEAGGRVAAPGDQLGPHAVAVDGRRRERVDRVLVEVAGDDDPGVVRTEPVELLPHLHGQQAEVTGVDADRAELRAGHLDAEPHRLGDVVGVDQQRGADAQGVDLRTERVLLGVVQERERVRAGARGRDAVAVPGREVRGAHEPGDVRRPRGRHRGLLVGASRAHLDAGPVAGDQGHPRGGRRDRRVVVVDREQHRLQHHRLGEAGLDDQQR